MSDIFFYLLIAIVVAASVVLIAVLVRTFLPRTHAPSGTLFRTKPERRLEIVDQANVDGRRKLILLRRDDTEHLIMTGGPADVVIETGIPRQSGKATGESALGATPPRSGRGLRRHGRGPMAVAPVGEGERATHPVAGGDHEDRPGSRDDRAHRSPSVGEG